MLFERQLEKVKIKHAFAQAATTYDSAADLQRKVGLNLLGQIISDDLTGVLLDVGCGTGFLSQKLVALSQIEQVIGLDIALPMLHITRHKMDGQKLLLVCADAEFLPFADHTINHIVSNLALQWCENLTAVFSDFKRVLQPQGQLLFSTFGEKTLQELKAAWAKVDDCSHVNHFYHADEIGFFLQQTGFQAIEIETKIYLSQYESVMALMHELKALGAHHVIKGGRKTITGKTKMQAMINEYETGHENGLIPATFEIITIKARV